MAGSLHFSLVRSPFTSGLKACATFAAAIALSGCHPQPAAAPPAHPAPPALPALQRAIDAALNDPALAHSYWGVLVKSLNTDETLYSLNARKLMMPASNMKIVTLAAAAEKLGWTYTYATTVRAVGAIDNGMLNGDLVVVGSGDPSLVAADGASDRVFASWASQIKSAGIRTIAGRVIGDDNTFDDETLGFGWSWDDLPDDYAAGVGALQLNEDAVRVTIAPGPAAGDLAAASVAPIAGGLAIDNTVVTAAAGGQPAVRTRRLPGSARLQLRGSIPLGHEPIVEAVSVDNPTQFFVTALRTALIANGIDVRGPAMDIDDVRDAPARTAGRPLVSYTSPPLSVLAERLMKASQNQYAETLFRTVGVGATPSILQPWGVAAGDLVQRDGSGLSRYDYVTPDALVTILTHIDRDARLKGPFASSLPIAGRDGSLANRMKGTAAENNARAKTGSMSNVRALSGYVTTADGEPLVFSIVANNFDVEPAIITQTTDAIVVRLAEFRR
jgi:serine-type D-Ala-D-Ala carboxypeptidase/endopeptidase (penicillin-binding protein 4)